jgi:hypothetical protein
MINPNLTVAAVSKVARLELRLIGKDAEISRLRTALNEARRPPAIVALRAEWLFRARRLREEAATAARGAKTDYERQARLYEARAAELAAAVGMP